MIERKYEITQRFDDLLRSLVNAMFAINLRILEILESMRRACDRNADAMVSIVAGERWAGWLQAHSRIEPSSIRA